MDGLIQIQVVVQGNAGVVGLVGLDTQGRGLVRRTLGSTIPARYDDLFPDFHHGLPKARGAASTGTVPDH